MDTVLHIYHCVWFPHISNTIPSYCRRFSISHICYAWGCFLCYPKMITCIENNMGENIISVICICLLCYAHSMVLAPFYFSHYATIFLPQSTLLAPLQSSPLWYDQSTMYWHLFLHLNSLIFKRILSFPSYNIFPLLLLFLLSDQLCLLDNFLLWSALHCLLGLARLTQLCSTLLCLSILGTL